MARGQKKTAALNASLAFLDEAGFQLAPSVRATWAPVGVTPVLRPVTRRDKLSVISAIRLSPAAHRIDLHYQVLAHNVRQEDMITFLRALLREVRGPIVLLWDNGSPHKGAAMRAFLRRHPRLHIVWFPPYAPELNPDEGVWQRAKHAVANSAPADLDQLLHLVCAALADIRHSPAALHSCITHATLP